MLYSTKREEKTRKKHEIQRLGASLLLATLGVRYKTGCIDNRLYTE